MPTKYVKIRQLILLKGNSYYFVCTMCVMKIGITEPLVAKHITTFAKNR